LPIEDLGIVIDQLTYLVTDPSKFDAGEFLLSLVNVATIFPPAKPLKLFTAPIRGLLRAIKPLNPKFARYIGGALLKVVRKAKKGQFDSLWNMLPFMVLGGQMYSDPETRKGAELLISSIDRV
jgi:hypothetical protein